jgi:hypothetical protein
MHSPATGVSRHLVTPRRFVRLVNPAIPGKGLGSFYRALPTPTPAPSLAVVVPLAGVVFALEVAPWVGKVGEGLQFVLLTSIAWVPAVLLLLNPKVAGWLFVLVLSAFLLSLVCLVLDVARDCGLTCGVNFWLTFAFGLGYVATKGLHVPSHCRGPDT